jgi:2-polyprenyl-3-methyl-5-hydroxy-6-metoxy-1,4-benzoquinol methylase
MTAAPHDAAFAKYAEDGAYHWREVSRHWLHHHAFTVERYRRTLAVLGSLSGCRVLDYGCGDGALLGWISRAVGPKGEAHGFDPNPQAVQLARQMLSQHRLVAAVHADIAQLPDGYFDAVSCAEVIEHVHDVPALLAHVTRVLKPGGRAVLTTPVRLTESPQDPNHIREWFPDEFAALFADGLLRLLRHEQIIPAAAAEVYFWRPPIFLRLPVFRLLCNLLSIYGGINALTWLRLRPRLFMMQLVLLERPA